MIKSVPGGDVWIGLSDTGSQGKFHWTDESDLDYTNWGVSQPDGSVLFPQPVSETLGNLLKGPEYRIKNKAAIFL